MAAIRGTYKKDLKVKDNWRLFIAMMPFAKNGQMVETKCAGVFTPMYEGQPFTFVGELENYKGSETFKVKSYTAEMPKGLDESKAFIRSVKGIGKKRGDAICEYCDGDLTRLTMDDVEKLKPLCHGLKEESLKKLIDRLNQVKMIGELQKTYGAVVTVEQLSRIVTKFENSVERVMKYHPYWTAPLVGFKVADLIGEIDKVKPNDAERLSAAVRHNLNELCRKYGSAMAVTDEVIANTMSMLLATKLGGVVQEDILKAMNAMRVNQEIRRCGHYVYPKKSLDNEKLLAEFVVYNTGKVSQEKQEAFKKAFAEWCVTHREMQLSAMQTSAVWTGGTNVVSVLTGGPGTGKTTCLQALIDSYAAAFPNENITLLAPTGLAAKRMSEKTGRPAKTIHSAFRLIPTDDDEKDEFAPDYNDALVQRIDSGLVVVDEFSMVGLDMAAFLIDHIDFSSGRCQIVMVGDVDQLPPIAAGSVLLHLITSGVVPVTVLDRNFRQTETTGIPELASEINAGKSVLSLAGGCSFDAVSTGNKELLCKEITEQYIKDYLQVRRSTEIKIPHQLFDAMKEVKNSAVNVYLAVAMAEHDGVAGDIQTIMRYANMKSISNVRKGLKELKKRQLIYKVDGWRSKGIPDTYKVSQFCFSGGFFSVEYLVAQDYLTLFSSEMCLLLVLRRICSHKTDVIVNQTQLGTSIGCTRTNACKLMKKLERRGYISVTEKTLDKVKFQCMVDVLK